MTEARGVFTGAGRSRALELSKVRTCSAAGRHNLVTIEGLRTPGDPHEAFHGEGFAELIARIREARNCLQRCGQHTRF